MLTHTQTQSLWPVSAASGGAGADDVTGSH